MPETDVFVHAPDSAEGSLPGILAMPEAPSGLVIFAHGSGSSRMSPRNRELAGALGRRGMATLLFDLLTPAEAGERANVFDIPCLLGVLSARSNGRPGWRNWPACRWACSVAAPAPPPR